MVKKASRFILLLLALLLLLSACSQQIVEQPEASSFNPSVQLKFLSLASAQTIRRAPSVTTRLESPMQLSTKWQTDREIVPFADRFKADVPFAASNSWLVPDGDNTYIRYHLTQQKSGYPLAVMQDETVVYEISCDRVLTDFRILSADGHWACLKNENEVIRVDLRTGKAATLLKRSENISIWYVGSTGKDTLYIFSVDNEGNLKISYRDVHTEAERILYNGIFPETPESDLICYVPSSTLGTVRWRAMSPDFYAIAKKELADPDSPFNWNPPAEYSHPFSLRYAYDLCCDIQKAHTDVLAQVEWSCDPVTGKLTAQYGIAAVCAWQGSECYHDHYDTEDTWQTPLIVLDPDPVPVPKLKREQPWDSSFENYESSGRAFLYSNSFNDQYIYEEQDGKYRLLLDIPCKACADGNGYIYALTQDNSILQFSKDGSIRNTIYTSENDLDGPMYFEGSIYFVDGDQVIRINTVEGTCSPILRCAGNIIMDSYGPRSGAFFIMIRQGLYIQQHFFTPDTLEVEFTWDL